MAIWVSVVDQLRRKKSLQTVTLEELTRCRMREDLKERRTIQRTQALELSKEKHFAQGLKVDSDRMKLYYSRKVKEVDTEVRFHEMELKGISQRIRLFNGLIALKRRISVRSADRSSLLDKISLAEVAPWIDEKTVDGDIQEADIDKLLDAVEGGLALASEGEFSEESDVRGIFELMRNASVDIGLPEDVAKNIMSEVNQVLREDNELQQP